MFLDFVTSGELEITVMKNFCRAGNVAALLQDDQFPEALKPFTSRVESLFDPQVSRPKKLSNSKLEPIDNMVLVLIMNYLNKENGEGCHWELPDKWCTKTGSQTVGSAPIPPRAFFYKQIEHLDVQFSTFTDNPNNSFIIYKSDLSREVMFGRIYSILVHRRSPKPSQNIVDTWLVVQSFPPIPKTMFNPMVQVDEPDVQVYLRAWGPTENHVIKLQEVRAHCSWIMYKAYELHKNLSIASLALVSMER